MEEKYFVASNSAEGFCSYYDNAFDIERFARIYAIKGGSGTGKATFMKKVAREAEKRGFSVRYIYCSSDAESLDGIIIKDLKIAVLDGTAPHIYEPHLIGAFDGILDLGQFLDEKKLVNRREEIEILSKKKGDCFKSAYKYLSAYRQLSENMEKLVFPAIKFEKIRKFISRFTDKTQGVASEENLLVNSIGMRGISHFNTYFEQAKIYYAVSDYFETAHIFMRELYLLFQRRGESLHISNNPIIKDRLDALCLTKSGLAFEITNERHEGTRKINIKRFIDLDKIAQIRAEYRKIASARDEMLELALDEFEKIKNIHFTLEKIYGTAMNFSAKEQFENEFCNKIFQNN